MCFFYLDPDPYWEKTLIRIRIKLLRIRNTVGDLRRNKGEGRSPFHPCVYLMCGFLQVWICPACGKQDDGSPMIGCDQCDDW